LIGDTKNLIASVTMPKTKSDCDANSCAKPPNKDADDAFEFVEVDPTCCYGWLAIPTFSYMNHLSHGLFFSNL
jgi:hypothetical protein